MVIWLDKSLANIMKAVNPFTFSDFAHLSKSRCSSACPIQCRSLWLTALDDPSQAPLGPQEAAQYCVDKSIRNWSGPARPKRCKLPFNLLQTSETDIHLFRNLSYYSDHTEINESYAQVICQQAIHQKIPPGTCLSERCPSYTMIQALPTKRVSLR